MRSDATELLPLHSGYALYNHCNMFLLGLVLRATCRT